MEKQFIQLQLALFFKNDFTGAIENASLVIKEKFGSDMGTQILNIPPIAPPEIPRLILNSNKVNINLSKNRIDFFFKDELLLSNKIEDIFDINTQLSIDVGRVGFVLTLFKESDLSDLKSLLNNSIVDPDSLKEITVRLNEIVSINGMGCNNIQSYVSGSTKDVSGVSKNGVVITRDINSLAKEMNTLTFDKSTLKKFLEEASSLSRKTLI